jgi:hypothetical protein
MDERDAVPSGGPWMYEDPDGRRYLVQVVPLEHDRTVDDSRQPKAVVFQTDEGWIRVSPVGHDFALEKLSHAEILNILQHAAGRPTRESGS